MTKPDMTFEAISRLKTDTVIGLLVSIAEGPREAYGILVTCIHRLNFEIIEERVSIDVLCEEVAATLRSVTEMRKDLQ